MSTTENRPARRAATVVMTISTATTAAAAPLTKSRSRINEPRRG
ncbi:hypothetical protein [Nocardioides luteus]|nr:hypothetical protein [Nocardioides luteus]